MSLRACLLSFSFIVIDTTTLQQHSQLLHLHKNRIPYQNVTTYFIFNDNHKSHSIATTICTIHTFILTVAKNHKTKNYTP